MSDAAHTADNPKSIRHKRILDLAADHPDASLEDIADHIPSVTADLVERVLDQYGDPADTDPDTPTDTPPDTQAATDEPTDTTPHPTESTTPASDPTDANDSPESADGRNGTEHSDSDDASADDTDTATADTETTDTETTDTEAADTASPSGSDDSSHPSLDDLTQKERDTLRAIYEKPSAPQREIADELDVSTATVSNRVNGIAGFDWSERASFASAVFDPETPTESAVNANTHTARTDGASKPDTPDNGSSNEMTTSETDDTDPELATRFDQLEDQLAAIETHLDDESATVFTDPELTHKVVHACMDSENISEDEELRILRALLS